VAAKQQAFEELRADFEKLEALNTKLREDLLRANREVIRWTHILTQTGQQTRWEEKDRRGGGGY